MSAEFLMYLMTTGTAIIMTIATYLRSEKKVRSGVFWSYILMSFVPMFNLFVTIQMLDSCGVFAEEGKTKSNDRHMCIIQEIYNNRIPFDEALVARHSEQLSVIMDFYSIARVAYLELSPEAQKINKAEHDDMVRMIKKALEVVVDEIKAFESELADSEATANKEVLNRTKNIAQILIDKNHSSEKKEKK